MSNGNRSYMKRYFLTLLLLAITMTVSAQQPKTDPRYQNYTGQYGSNSGICLFNDGTFLLYGYATGVFGRYKFEQDQLLFYPDQPELFEVYSHQNKSIGDSTRINYIGFQDGNTFVRFNNDNFQRVFNEEANCFDAPFVNQTAQQARQITFSGAEDQSWEYVVPNGQNDLIFIYNKPRREYENFTARMEEAEGKKVLKLSNYGGDEGYEQQKVDEEQQHQWKEILGWKEQYDQSKDGKDDVVFANTHYHVFPDTDIERYSLDQPSNQYISRDAQENEDRFRNDQYNNDRYLRKYVKLQPHKKGQTKLTKDRISAGSIFFTVCGEGSEKSYHYNGFRKTPVNEESGPLIQTVPPPPIN